MKFSWMVFGLISIVLMTSLAFAQINAPESVTLTAQENTFSFSVTNEKAQTLPIRIQVTGPFDVTFTPAPGSIGPNERQNVIAKVRLTSHLEGQTYESTIVVKMGEERTYQPITLHFQNVQTNTPKPDSNAGTGTGFAFLGGFNLNKIPVELLIDLFLVIVLIVAIVAVAVRVKNRWLASKTEGR